jgi:RND superfamily putative drug exporter
MIGLAVGIDYSLFIVSRYREERANGLDKLDAVARTGASASKAVFFSGLTVVVALMCVLLLPNTIYRSIGLGVILVVITAVAASLTLLPAVLTLMATRWTHGSAGGRGRTGPVRDRITGAVALSSGRRHPGDRRPYFSINEGFSGVSTLPREAKQASSSWSGTGRTGSPVEIIDGDITPSVTASMEDLRAAMKADPSFALGRRGEQRVTWRWCRCPATSPRTMRPGSRVARLSFPTSSRTCPSCPRGRPAYNVRRELLAHASRMTLCVRRFVRSRCTDNLSSAPGWR